MDLPGHHFVYKSSFLSLNCFAFQELKVAYLVVVVVVFLSIFYQVSFGLLVGPVIITYFILFFYALSPIIRGHSHDCYVLIRDIGC